VRHGTSPLRQWPPAFMFVSKCMELTVGLPMRVVIFYSLKAVSFAY